MIAHVKYLPHVLLLAGGLALAGCGGSSSSGLSCDPPQVANTAGTECVDPDPDADDNQISSLGTVETAAETAKKNAEDANKSAKDASASNSPKVGFAQVEGISANATANAQAMFSFDLRKKIFWNVVPDEQVHSKRKITVFKSLA